MTRILKAVLMFAFAVAAFLITHLVAWPVAALLCAVFPAAPSDAADARGSPR